MLCPRCCCIEDRNYEVSETHPKLGIVCYECDYCAWQGFRVWANTVEDEEAPSLFTRKD